MNILHWGLGNWFPNEWIFSIGVFCSHFSQLSFSIGVLAVCFPMKISKHPEASPLLQCKHFGELVKPQDKHLEKKKAKGEKIKHPAFFWKSWSRRDQMTSQKRTAFFFSLSPFGYFFLPEKPLWFDLLEDLSSWQDKSSSQKGWVSIDRSVVAALPSTTPRPVHKSSTDDLGPPPCQVSDRESREALWASRQGSRHRDGVRRLSFPEQNGGSNGIVAVTRRDSALEAFRHNPTDGSFAPPADRPSTYTKCPNLRFLSY